MAKGFKFKLQPVLRLKELREEEIKSKLGVVISSINSKLQKIDEYKNEINFYFDRYEKSESIKGEMTSGLRQYMPEFLVSHYNKIRQHKKEIEELLVKKNDLIQSLNEAKGQVKIFSNMREKKLFEYKYQMNKKINNDLEELTILKGSKK